MYKDMFKSAEICTDPDCEINKRRVDRRALHKHGTGICNSNSSTTSHNNKAVGNKQTYCNFKGKPGKRGPRGKRCPGKPGPRGKSGSNRSNQTCHRYSMTAGISNVAVGYNSIGGGELDKPNDEYTSYTQKSSEKFLDRGDRGTYGPEGPEIRFCDHCDGTHFHTLVCPVYTFYMDKFDKEIGQRTGCTTTKYPESIENEPSAIEGEDECKVCFERSVKTVFIPCGHTAVCVTCSLEMKDRNNQQCPICNGRFTACYRTYG